MKNGLMWTLGGVIGFSANAVAQTVPPCPVASDVRFESREPPPSYALVPLTPALPILIYTKFRPYLPASGEIWNVYFINAAYSGSAIAVDGYVVPEAPVGIPPPPLYFSLGNLSAGNYNVTVRPVFAVGGINPPIACPELVLPLIVNALPGSEPVPVGFAPLAVLAGLLASAGLWFSRRRYRLR